VSATTLVRKGIKAAVYPVGVAGRTRPGDVAVLLYHTIGLDTGEIDTPADAFERQLAWLQEHERVRSLDDALTDPHGGVVLTFDDGYADFVDTVVPLLVKYRMPVILYLATSLVEGTAPTPAPRLSWRALRDALETGLVTIGSHTHDHSDLSKATEADARAEMERANRLIADRLGVSCRHFAYPWSVASIGAERAAAALFETAALPVWRINRRGRVDPLRLARIPILRSDTGRFYGAKVRGMLDGESLAYRALRRGPWGRG
jgi:peptidoglycan/xylan/chitin deacetylase (PgdA/CDA1 family)